MYLFMFICVPVWFSPLCVCVHVCGRVCMFVGVQRTALDRYFRNGRTTCTPNSCRGRTLMRKALSTITTTNTITNTSSINTTSSRCNNSSDTIELTILFSKTTTTITITWPITTTIARQHQPPTRTYTITVTVWTRRLHRRPHGPTTIGTLCSVATKVHDDDNPHRWLAVLPLASPRLKLHTFSPPPPCSS